MSSNVGTPTFFAPAERQDDVAIRRQFEELIDEGRITEVLDASPYISMVTNSTRQIVFANNKLQTLLDVNKDFLMGRRPGELFSCPNSSVEPGGCGTSVKCRYCGVVHVLLEAYAKNERVIREARMFILKDGRYVPFDVRVTATPMMVGTDSYLMVFLDDISTQKKKERLERTFFHDVMNAAGGVKNLAMYLAETLGERSSKASHLLVEQSDLLIEEIRSQRLLVEAESDELALNPVNTNALVLFTEARSAAEALKVAEGRNIESKINGGEQDLLIDTVLAKRALLNALKNALEAVEKGDTVFFTAVADEKGIEFRIANSTVMTEEVKSQVFLRSFSTKGTGRGIGTYSMRLLVEHYLGGHVSFSSKEGEGTIFTISLPLGSKPSSSN